MRAASLASGWCVRHSADLVWSVDLAFPDRTGCFWGRFGMVSHSSGNPTCVSAKVHRLSSLLEGQDAGGIAIISSPWSDTASALKALRDTWGNQTAKHISGDLTLWTLESWDLHMPSMWQKNRVLPWESQLQEGGRRKASWSEDTGCLTCSVVQGNGGSGGCRWGEPRDPEDQSWRGCILGISVVFMTLSSLHLRFLAHSGSVLTNKLSNTARVSCKGLSEAQRIETWVGKVLPGDAWDRLASKLSSCCEE